ncbi:hypothetical protein PHJA_002706800 [Phtheirospermum japonicum]|uniref:BZIP domain-containing protein n=1 Tax=Phtheirospermum japonicum TaxID=374723 RepID=A0A830D1U2_9LAMI|nr:hypothetical protein PHJA_002706800 [Phtheirospermum japonicum]
MSGADEEWVKSAMLDDAMVGELLVRLHHAPPLPPPPLLKRAALPLEWSVRQRRSKSVCANNNPKKPAHRGSPTTPLSWSGATSFSGGSGGAGSEESSRPVAFKLSDTTRSKVVNIDSEKTNSKRSRKKKTLAELKHEENLLLKERRDLKKEMATLRLYLERQRATNGKLKRMKVELQPCLDKKSKSTSLAEESISGQLHPESTASHSIPTIMPPVVPGNDITLQPSASHDACPEEKTDAKFVLPDLNMPFDEPSCDVIC